nr:SDR family NAD(P)-dependent oxidoreductase [Brevibacillus laterosporus]
MQKYKHKDISEEKQRMEAMNELFMKVLLVQLSSIGSFTSKNSSPSSFQAKMELPDFYNKWLEVSFDFLIQEHYIKQDGETYHICNQALIDQDMIWKEWEIKKIEWLEDSNTRAKVVLAETMLRALPDILTGKRKATEIMFPDSSMQLVEGIYKYNKLADYFNNVLADTVISYVQNRLDSNANSKIRIVEIGAGTGGTSATVLQKLTPYHDHIQEYCYTDISKAFLMHGAKEYGTSNPFLTYNMLNINETITKQNMDVGGYDVVIAANVLHATPNIHQTIRHAKTLLKRNGIIVVNEITEKTLFNHLTFGLLEGWWLYEDPALRIPGCPGLCAKGWEKALTVEGFTSVSFPAVDAEELGQQIIIAKSDGLIRQKQDIQKNSIKDNKRSEIKKTISSPKSIESIDNQMIEQKILDHITNIIIQKISESLLVDFQMISQNESFSDYGVDSITGVKLVQVINEALNIKLDTTTLFDYSSVTQLASYIISEYKSIIMQQLFQNVEQKSVSQNKTLAKEQKNSEPISSTSVSKTRIESEINIAIIGMSGRFAKSETVHDLWEHLSRGNDLIEEVSRWDLSTYYKQGASYCNQGSFVDDIEQFDPLFFNISGTEAEYMDPQQRIFLEESWKALEDAGYAGAGVQGKKCGIYVGCGGINYQNILGENPPPQAFWGTANSIIPARIAYYLDLQGPAIAVDTACSSSLVAIHLACQSLWAKETEMALAGGVFIQSTPEIYRFTNRAGMLSPTGRCHTFDERADGFVLGEGAGVVMLKRLSDAIADGDHIYGVIRGSAINQDGTTNGITAPSAKSQERLEQEVYDTFQIDPQHIQMVEAHGTGTKLGDPIEYKALTRAFNKYSNEKNYCAIGSIKSNIGHLTFAAGVAGLIKILLSLQHKQIPPTLHYEKGNSNIEFEDSPFYVNTELTEWSVEPNMKRNAAISSFGFSGTNAHMVIEEAPLLSKPTTPKPGYLITLSARTLDQLHQQVERLIQYCETEGQIDYGNMSYTLIMGRKHFNHRLACVVHERNELVNVLKTWLEKGEAPDVYASALSKKGQQEQIAMKQYGNECIRNVNDETDANVYVERLSTLASLYTQGYELEFEKMFSQHHYSRIPLPTYPFAKERYWIPEAEYHPFSNKHQEEFSASINEIHPMLHQNTSDLFEIRFSTTLTGKEFFLEDQVSNGCKVLPGVAQLEMARIAVEKAIGSKGYDQATVQLQNIVWTNPICIEEQPKQVHIGLFLEDDGEVSFEIYSDLDEGRDEIVVHSQGRAVYNDKTQESLIDLPTLLAECNQRILTTNDFYTSWEEKGEIYGKSLQGIEQMYVGKGQVLARLSFPSDGMGFEGQYVLHPSVMDAALQISLMFSTVAQVVTNVFLKEAIPVTLEKIEVLRSCSTRMWSRVRSSEACMVDNETLKVDIDLIDDNGLVCIRMIGLMLTALETEGHSVQGQEQIGRISLEPVWREQAIIQKEIIPSYHKHIVMLCEPFEALQEHMAAQTNEVTFICLRSEASRIEQRFEAYAVQAFETVQQIIRSKPNTHVLLQIVGSHQGEQQVFSGLVGLLKTARLENPKLIGQMIEVDQEDEQTELIEKIMNNKQSPEDIHIRYVKGKRQVASWNEMEILKQNVTIPWKDGGVYLITGGAGGLGLIFAEEIARKIKNGTLLLTGRSELSGEKLAKLKELQTLDARIIYKQVDITRKDAVDHLVKRLIQEFGSLNGIIHSAGIIQDNFILKKSVEEVKNVLAPKVAGSIYLDEATKDLHLDFFLFFSSMSGAIGNPGQADYAMGNAFMDCYAEYRNHLVNINERKGQTFSINWPLWKEGGMHVHLETEKMLLQSTGMIGIETKTGIENIYQMFTSKKNRLVLMEGNLPKLRSYFVTKEMKKEKPSLEQTVIQVDLDTLEEKTMTKFRRMLGEQLKLSIDQIDASESLDRYGIDSLVIIELNQKLERIFGECSKTIFYEYQTIEELTKYFTLHFREQCMEWTGLTQEMKVGAQVPEVNHGVKKELPTPVSSIRKKQFSRHVPVNQIQQNQREPIAIIGMSGHYPQASNLQQYWNNLAQGKDCIVEIPEERWSTENFYDADRKEAFAKGKSYSKWGGFIQDFASFDPLFFSISPREAMNMDPQERLFIQSCWEALEDAGYTKEQLTVQHKGRVGVFAGITKTGFQLYGPQLWKEGEELFPYTSFSSIANRVSYLLNLRGPSMPIDTMCSSSLTAIHEACEHIRHGECEMAIVGGVNLYLHPSNYVQLCGQQMLSAEGKCKSFGQAADGFVPGEGVGSFLLKPLSKAMEDGDHIHALIRATSINHGGKTNGYTVPNPVAQGELVREAIERAGINARTISYIEAHGTGTELGDPIEITGLNQAFGKDTQDTNFCAIGSVKSNIGHLEAAAGIAGLTKIVLQMKHQKLAPSLHAKELNPNINFAKTPFAVQQELTEWKRPVMEINGITRECPRIAGISSFGAGGANAHVIVEEFISSDEVQSTISHQKSPVIIVLSAKNEDRLKDQAKQLLVAIQEQNYSDRDLESMAYTFQVGREAMEERVGMIVSSMKDLEEKIRGYINDQVNLEDVYQGQVKRNKETVSIFLADEELQEAIQKWIERKKYSKLLHLWVKGLSFDWNKLYGKNKPRRMSLPTYPFAKERYWIPQSGDGITPEAVIAPRESNHDNKIQSRKNCFVKKQWQSFSTDGTKELKGTIGILTTSATEQLAKYVSERIANTRMMNVHTLKPHSSHSEEEWKKYAGIIDVTGCGSEDSADQHWISTLQNLIGVGKRDDMMLLCVTKGLESFKNDSVNLAGASRVGLYRTLQSEYSQVRSRHMDIERHLEDSILAEQIVSEFFAQSQDVEVCYRDGQRYRAYLDVIEDEIDIKGQKQVFPHSHVLWITGGTRGLGLLCAKHFVENYGVTRIVLTGREVLPPREEWELYKEHHSSTAQKIRSIEQLERLGAHIQVLSVSLSDEDEVRKSMEHIKLSMGPIGGVIHCAGSVDMENPAFIRKSSETIKKVMEPKIQGLNVIYQSVKDEPLQFFVLFSSVSAIVPSLGTGQSDYAMANAYMDYFSESVAYSCPIVSIQWPSWKETGMGEVKSSSYEQTGMLSMTNEEGLSLLDRIIAKKMGPVVLPAVIQSQIWNPKQLMQTKSKDIGENHVQMRPEILHYVELDQDELMQKTTLWLVTLFSKELMLDPSLFEADILFQEYGMDSILLAQIITRMDRELKIVALDPSVLLEYPTIGSLAAYLIETYSEVLETLFSIKSKNPELKSMLIESEHIVVPKPQEKMKGHANTSNDKEKIAVVGIACHFPDARNAREYWENLKMGKDSIREIPKSRWDIEKLYTSNDYTKGKSISKWGAFLHSIEEFDPDYFHVSESLASQIDPLQRQLLEVSAEAIFDAGYKEKDLWNKQVGVFVGARASNFTQKLDQSNKDTIVGTGQNFIAAHLSHVYNFKGPNMVIDTACSSSLTAIHLAVRSIQNGESELALAGGVDILLDETPYVALSAANVLSRDGRCKTFSAKANGIGLGEGCGVLILKPLQQAIRDQNKIYGVIDGSSINNDGNTMGITTPNPEAQRELIEKAIVDAKINPETISYVETHGTGTLIGDPIELKALTQVFKKHTLQRQYCGVGSVKSNIGHLMSAAGIASFIKVLLSLVHEELPATLHCEHPNPRFHFEESPFFIVQESMKWTSTYDVLRAGLSAFGLGGNNAHIIVSNEGIPLTHRVPLESINPNILFQRKRYWPEGKKDASYLQQLEEHNRRMEQNLAYYEPIRVERRGE